MHDRDLIRNGVLVAFLDALLPLFTTLSQSLLEIVVKVGCTGGDSELDIVFVDFVDEYVVLGIVGISPVKIILEDIVDWIVEIVVEESVD